MSANYNLRERRTDRSTRTRKNLRSGRSQATGGKILSLTDKEEGLNEPFQTRQQSLAMNAYSLLVTAGKDGLKPSQLARRLKVPVKRVQTLISEVRKHHPVRKIENGKTTEGAYYIPDLQEMDSYARRNEPFA
jgi:hypothetical protein